MSIKVLNLYAGIGGNRQLWRDVVVDAVERDEGIASIYKDFFPDDQIIVADAHEYLLEHYSEYDFIWSSPPCPTHSQYRYNVGVIAKGYKPVYPDMKLYEEIIFLKHHFSGKWVVENTISYYEPLIKPQKISRHYLWSNFYIEPIEIETTKIRRSNKIRDLEEFFDISISKYKVSNKRQVLRNCVNPILGKHILECAYR